MEVPELISLAAAPRRNKNNEQLLTINKYLIDRNDITKTCRDLTIHTLVKKTLHFSSKPMELSLMECFGKDGSKTTLVSRLMGCKIYKNLL